MGFVDLHGGVGRRYGSLGLALEGPCTRIRLEPASGVVAEGPDAARAARYATALAERFGLPEGARIDVEEAIPPHAGLGSGTQLALAVGAGMARLFDLDVRTVDVAAALDRGTRSGLGIGLFDQGGFVVDGGSAGDGVPPPVIARLPFPSEWRLLLVFDRGGEGAHGKAEIEKFAALREFPEADAAELCRLVLMCALPGVVEADLDAFGSAVGRIQARVGDHFAAVQGGRFASPGVSRVLEWLGSHGLKAVGQSSWGPTGFAVCPSESIAHRLMAEAQVRFGREFGLDFAVTRGRNCGAQVENTLPAH
jgi:beta-RFAP synthase